MHTLSEVLSVLLIYAVFPAFSFPFLLKAFFTSRLIGCAHKFFAALAFLSNQNLAFGSDYFFDWPQIGEEWFVDGHG